MRDNCQLCASCRSPFKNGLPLICEYVITTLGSNEVQFCLCMASSVKKLRVKTLTLNSASLPNLKLVPHSVMSLVYL